MKDIVLEHHWHTLMPNFIYFGTVRTSNVYIVGDGKE